MGFTSYDRPLEQAAYVGSSALVRSYQQRLKQRSAGNASNASDDPSLHKPARPLGSKRWVIMFVVVCTAVLGLSKGPELPEMGVRGPLDMSHFVMDTRPVTRPMSHVVWSMRGTMTMAGNPLLEQQGFAFVSGHVIPLASQWLADLSMPSFAASEAPLTNPALWAYVKPGELFAELPDLDPVRLSPFSVASGEALNEDGTPLRWNTDRQICEVSPAAQGELMARLEAWERQQSAYSRSLQARAERYQPAVETWSRRYNLNADLLYAIIYTESSFNPNLISGRDAHGLMQVVPNTAGGEVKKFLGETGNPTTEELLNPSTNIQYGAAYFRLLLKRYFPGVKDSLSREYCAIAAYNAGSSQILKLFGPTRDEAFQGINRLTPEQVLDILLTKAPSRETRGFLKKVIASRSHFVAVN